jgi:hypothetical protein
MFTESHKVFDLLDFQRSQGNDAQNSQGFRFYLYHSHIFGGFGASCGPSASVESKKKKPIHQPILEALLKNTSRLSFKDQALH